MGALGIYFGPKTLSLLECKGKKIITHSRIPASSFATLELEDKVPEDIKIIALLKDELRKNNVGSKDATIVLSGKDLIIRTFEMPVLPADELESAVNFEVKKYIPFKVEELVSQVQWKLDKDNRKYLVLFAGIKEEVLNKYLGIVKQLNLKADAVEYSAFSIFRLIKLSGMNAGGIFAVANVDLIEEDEVNFIVFEDGFPLFSRDIVISGSPESLIGTEGKITDPSMLLDKFKSEFRISLDYYQRKYPQKRIERVLFLTNTEFYSDFAVFMDEMGQKGQKVELNRFIGNQFSFCSDLIKGYSGSLSKAIKAGPKINLATTKKRPLKEKAMSFEQMPVSLSLTVGLRLHPITLVSSFLLCILAYSLGLMKTLPLNKEIMEIKSRRPAVSRTINPDSTYEELVNVSSALKGKIQNLDVLLIKQVYVTDFLNILPRVVPENMWLTKIFFDRQTDKTSLRLEGRVYLGESNLEMETLNRFVSTLKANEVFNSSFPNIKIVSVDKYNIGKETLTSFLLSCESKESRRN